MGEFNSEMNLDMDILNNLNSEVQGIMGSLAESFLELQQPLPNVNFPENIHNNSHSDRDDPNNPFFPSVVGPSGEKNMGGKEILELDRKSVKKNYGVSGKKRKRDNEMAMEKPKEVVHVRARRGQATDSHSLAERLRREKINEKLRSLQDLVPGCYKTMGMAVMLDVIINYVRSLQNQIEFLSMKLSAASAYYDFNSEMDPTDTVQGTNGYEAAQGMEIGEGYEGGFPYFSSTWPL